LTTAGNPPADPSPEGSAAGFFYLQHADLFDQVAKLASPTGIPEVLSKARSPEARSAPLAGRFAWIDGRLVCLFRLGGALWLRIAGQVVAVDGGVSAHWDLVSARPAAKPLRATFRLERNGSVLAAFEYPPFEGRRIVPGDPTPFVDEEDYDFMILVWRVIQDPGRRQRYFAVPAESQS
jgi:hypothetical protein